MNLYGADEKTLPQSEAEFVAAVGESLLVTVTRADGTTYDEYRHAWTEQSADPATGEYSDASPARSGTTTLNYLTELSGRQIDAGTLARAWLKSSVNGEVVYECLNPTGGAGDTIYVTNTTVNYTTDIFNYYSTTIENINSTFITTINGIWVINGPGFLVINAPLVICGWLFWCFRDHTVNTAVLTDWADPSTLGTEAVVWRLDSASDFAISGIVPAGAASDVLSQVRLAGDAGGWLFNALIHAEDFHYVRETIPQGTSSPALITTDYALSILTNATVVGIAVRIPCHKAGAGVITDTEVHLRKASGRAGTPQTSAHNWVDFDTDVSLGGSADLWGTTWTPAEINAGLFGCDVVVTEDGTGDVTAFIDTVEITVYYTTPSDRGQVIALANVSAKTMTLVNEDAGSVATNRFALENAASKTVGPGGIVLCWYDPETGRWRVFRQNDAAAAVTATNGSATLGGAYTMSGSSAQDTGLQVTLPTVGTYLLSCSYSASYSDTFGATSILSVSLYDSTTATYLISQDAIYTLNSSLHLDQGNLTCLVTTANVNEVVKLRVAATAFGTIVGIVNAATLSYVRVA